jgi:NedA-like, galactose-binding domain
MLDILIRTYLVAIISLIAAATSRGDQTGVVENTAYLLTASVVNGAIHVTLDDRLLGLRVAYGPYVYRATPANARAEHETLRDGQVSVKGDHLTVRGRLAGLDLEQTFTLPPDRPIMEERIRLRNGTRGSIALLNLQLGFQRPITDPSGKILPELTGDRITAVPLRHRADSARVLEYSLAELIAEPGHEYRPAESWQRKKVVSAPHRASEGWAWAHGGATLGVFSFSQDLMRFSVIAAEKTASGIVLRFGGMAMVSGEPAALSRIGAGQTVDLGFTRYQTVKGGFVPAAYAFRVMLDENGCRFPADYNPPVHWEQLYDMEGAWDDRLHRYTKAVVEKEAAKGRAYHCEALYLDPGWDTTFGSFLWGQDWLGPQTTFARRIKENYGLTLALHCPMPPWASSPGMAMGPFKPEDWPAACRRQPPQELTSEQAGALKVPAVRDGCRNLALLAGAKASASSTIPGLAIHQVAHLNDGWYGNDRSWVAGTMPAWVEIDLGSVHSISRVFMSNDQQGVYIDRAASKLRVLTSVNHDSWKTVADHLDAPLESSRSLTFDAVQARWLRIEVVESREGDVRFDEIEVYEAQPTSDALAAEFARTVNRGPAPPAASDTGPLLCMGSKQFLAEAEKRLLARCAEGVVFLMFDGTWWNGPCTDPAHGHAIPYRMEDHMRACLDLAKRVHARYPHVLIEMHDMLAGGSTERMTPVYYKYGLPGSYDDNWGFELMWDPMADLKSGRARTLYDYNLGCNVPVYLHIDLRKDNENCVVFWWYASTCRHLGIGGTHKKAEVVGAQQAAMRRYRELDRFFKRGEFFGINEEIHVHALKSEQAMVVNVFNLSGDERKVGGKISLQELGLDPGRSYSSSEPWAKVEGGQLQVDRQMPAWSAGVVEIRSVR